MNILKYLLSKPYRDERKSEYAKELSSRFVYEETCRQEIYEAIFGAGEHR